METAMPEIAITIPALRAWAKTKEPTALVVTPSDHWSQWSQSCPVATYLKEHGASHASVCASSSHYTLGGGGFSENFMRENEYPVMRVVWGVDDSDDLRHINAAEFLKILDRAEAPDNG
jgi:hypothetical protein